MTGGSGLVELWWIRGGLEELEMLFVVAAGGVPAWCGAVDVKYGS